MSYVKLINSESELRKKFTVEVDLSTLNDDIVRNLVKDLRKDQWVSLEALADIIEKKVN